MEENENKRNPRIIYLIVAIALAMVTIIVIASAVANRPNISSSDTNTDSSDQTTNGDNSDTLPSFSLPVNGEISMDFSDTVPVFSQTLNDYRTHLGVDISASLGDEVLAVADGVVTNVWDDPFMGTCISIEHSGNAVSIYKNLDPDVADGIIIGASVSGGEVIGAVGESAMNELASEPHLHYELKVDGVHIDPKKHFKFPGQKLDGGNEESDNESSNTSTDSKQ